MNPAPPVTRQDAMMHSSCTQVSDRDAQPEAQFRASLHVAAKRGDFYAFTMRQSGAAQSAVALRVSTIEPGMLDDQVAVVAPSGR